MEKKINAGDKTSRIWDVESGDCIKTLEGHKDNVCGVSFSSNNQYVVSGGSGGWGKPGEIRIWDVV